MIDSHVHFWNYHPLKDAWINDEMKVIQRDFTPADLEKELKESGVKGCIAVQASQTEQETEFLLAYAHSYPFIKGVVGWVDLQGQDLAATLTEYSKYERLVGWRHVAQAEPEGFLVSHKFLQGITELKNYQHTYDILIHSSQLKEAISLVEKFPDQRFILDHLAKPDIKNKQGNEAWAKHIKTLSQHCNVYCKISGMVNEANWYSWNYDEMVFYLDTVFETFGAYRLMFGSDWPVCTVAANYKQTKQIIGRYTDQLSEKEQKAVFEVNAVECYGLKL